MQSVDVGLQDGRIPFIDGVVELLGLVFFFVYLRKDGSAYDCDATILHID